MYEVIFGSKMATRVLLFISHSDEAYASQIAKKFDVSLSMVQKQLHKFEAAKILVSYQKGKSKIYRFNPKFILKRELQILLNKIISTLPKEEKEKYLVTLSDNKIEIDEDVFYSKLISRLHK